MRAAVTGRIPVSLCQQTPCMLDSDCACVTEPGREKPLDQIEPRLPIWRDMKPVMNRREFSVEPINRAQVNDLRSKVSGGTTK